mmetsp:Transcript_11082/g.34643  ORF Transcript_11082/g.34643 Transcript_11082/m.34643 type:complete len:314 (+) Transcript_11082:296-1237(+)
MSCGFTLFTYSSTSIGILFSTITSATFLAMPLIVSNAFISSRLLVRGSSDFSSKTRQEQSAMMLFASMSAKTFWKTISVMSTSSADVSSQAMRPLSMTTPSLSMNSSRRSTRRMARRSSLMTMKRLWLICLSSSCTLPCNFTFLSKASKYSVSFPWPLKLFSPSFASRSPMLASTLFISSVLMFISPTGSSSGMPLLNFLWPLMVARVLSSARRESSDLGSPSGMLERILLIRCTRGRTMASTWPSAALAEAGGCGLFFSKLPGSQGRKTSTTHWGSGSSESMADCSAASGATLRFAAVTRMPQPQSASPSRM